MKHKNTMEALADALNNIADALDYNQDGIRWGVSISIERAGSSVGDAISSLASNVDDASDALNRIADAIDKLAYVGERFLDEKTED